MFWIRTVESGDYSALHPPKPSLRSCLCSPKFASSVNVLASVVAYCSFALIISATLLPNWGSYDVDILGCATTFNMGLMNYYTAGSVGCPDFTRQEGTVCASYDDDGHDDDSLLPKSGSQCQALLVTLQKAAAASGVALVAVNVAECGTCIGFALLLRCAFVAATAVVAGSLALATVAQWGAVKDDWLLSSLHDGYSVQMMSAAGGLYLVVAVMQGASLLLGCCAWRAAPPPPAHQPVPAINV